MEVPLIGPAGSSSPVVDPFVASSGIQSRNTKRRNKPESRLGDLTKARYVVVEHDGGVVRLVQPYFHDFETTFKERWRGKTLLEVYETEFKVTLTTPPGSSTACGSSCSGTDGASAKSDSYFAKAIRAGFIRANREHSDPLRIIKQGDRISRLSHRHEPPVVYRSARELVVREDGDLVICNKPGSLPIHPSGAYRFNTLLYVLAVERPDLGHLFTIHRLDRLTSGLVILSKSSDGAKLVSDAIQNNAGLSARKTYIARVSGRFPSSKADMQKEQRGVTFAEDDEVESEENASSSTSSSGWITVSFPINVLDPSKGVHICDEENGRDSISRFLFLAYDAASDSSLVKCEPITGRTHQLRLHLQLLGHAIVNDPNYGPESQLTGTESHSKKLREDEDGNEEAEDVMTGQDPYVTRFAESCQAAIRNANQGESDESLLAKQAQQEQLPEATLKAVLDLCVGCSHGLHPIRHKEIWLHACRFRVNRTNFRETVQLMDFRVPFPPWIQAFSFDQDGFWRD